MRARRSGIAAVVGRSRALEPRGALDDVRVPVPEAAELGGEVRAELRVGRERPLERARRLSCSARAG